MASGALWGSDIGPLLPCCDSSRQVRKPARSLRFESPDSSLASAVSSSVSKGHRTSFGFYWTEGIRGLGAAVDAVPTLKGGSTIGIPSSPAILLPNGRVVTPDIRDAERLQGFPADWTQPAETVARKSVRWKLVGNAITVDVANWIGLRLVLPGEYDDSWDSPLPKGAPWPGAAWNMGEGRHAAVLSPFPFLVEGPPIHDFRLARLPQANTGPELAVRLMLREEGIRYRLNNRDLPGSPDLANRSKRWAIFVNGCYWHHHKGCKRATVPKRNSAFWLDKFDTNRRRDARVIRELRASGYKVLLCWECDVEERPQIVAERIRRTLRQVRGNLPS